MLDHPPARRPMRDEAPPPPPAPAPAGLQSALVAFAVRRPGIVLALVLAFAVYGVVALGSAKYDVFP